MLSINFDFQAITKKSTNYHNWKHMKIKLIIHGKTSFSYLQEGISEYTQRINRYLKFEIITLADIKNTSAKTEAQIKHEEGKILLEKLEKKDYVILLDEKGKHFDSVKFATFIENQMINSTPWLVFVIGGAYGFSADVYQRAQQKLALSAMTFSHQLIRLIFMEQLYRAFTIINKEPYHHA